MTSFVFNCVTPNLITSYELRFTSYRVSRELLARVWKAGAGPGDAPFTIDLDSTMNLKQRQIFVHFVGYEHIAGRVGNHQRRLGVHGYGLWLSSPPTGSLRRPRTPVPRLPSGRFAANGAWLAVQVMAHNLARWTARIGLGQQIVTTKTLRRRVFALAGRITRSARRLTLHLPRRWPWEEQFSRALARLRAIPLPA